MMHVYTVIYGEGERILSGWRAGSAARAAGFVLARRRGIHNQSRFHVPLQILTLMADHNCPCADKIVSRSDSSCMIEVMTADDRALPNRSKCLETTVALEILVPRWAAAAPANQTLPQLRLRAGEQTALGCIVFRHTVLLQHCRLGKYDKRNSRCNQPHTLPQQRRLPQASCRKASDPRAHRIQTSNQTSFGENVQEIQTHT